jgi:prepilin-type N-terminal cleavage/methylation domain-containing protein
MKILNKNNGFTLVELMVVLVVILILSFMTIGAFSSEEVRVRGLVFNMMADFNMARSTAVRLGKEVLVEMLSTGEMDDDGRIQAGDGYRICLDDDADGNCDLADQLLREVLLGDGLKFYDADISAPTGPDRTVTGVAWTTGGNGISFSADRFVMKATGVSSKAGTIYVFSPGGRDGIRGGPLALVLNRIGRMRISRWRSDIGEWRTK